MAHKPIAAPVEPRGGFDVQALPNAKRLLAEIPAAARILITGRALKLLAQHPSARRADTDTLAHRLWADVRTLTYDADGHTIDSVMQHPAIGGAPHRHLKELLTVLLEAGDAECSLVAERDRIDLALSVYRWMRETQDAPDS